MSVIKNTKVAGQTFNIGSGTNHSILEIANFIGEKHIFISLRPGEAKETKANNTKAKNILGWSPSINVKDWIKANS